ncbi:PAS domain-containing sensor histidine kinase [Candidatus Woesearchaeota archaeon]|nr:PAS domain-containing sensor histidine kinase [Candidatus Woesearchaeota archaeon]
MHDRQTTAFSKIIKKASKEISPLGICDFSNALVNTAQAIALVLDTKGKILWFNPYMEKLSGYKLYEVCGKDWFTTFLSKGDRQGIIKLFSKAIGKKRTRGNVNPIVTKKGELRHIEWYDTVLKGKDKGIVGLLAIGHDITERRKAEECVRKEQKKFRTYLNLAAVIMLAIDCRGKVTYINKKGCDILKCSKKDIIGKSWFNNFIPARLRKGIRDYSLQILEGKLHPFRYRENPVLCRDGTEKLIAWHNILLRDDDGNIIGHLSSGQDITRRKKAEDGLKKSEENYKFLYEFAPLPYQSLDKDENILRVNSAWLKALGYKMEEVIGKNFSAFINPQHVRPFRKFCFGSLRGKQIPYFEFELKKKDGSFITVLFKGKAAYGDKGRFIRANCIFTDITEKKKAENIISDRLRRLKEIDAMKDDFMHMAGHELKTPLVPLFGYLGILADRRQGSLSPAHQQALDSALMQARILNKVIDDILDAAKLQTSRMRFNFRMIDPGKLVTSVAGGFSSLAKDKGIGLRLKVGRLPRIRGDKARLAQALENLISNAIKFTEKGSVTVSAGKAKGSVIITVKDTGIGIRKRFQENIFRKFFQADSSITRKAEGVGLGLSICKGVIKAHNGNISVKSRPGKGSVFSVSLPLP